MTDAAVADQQGERVGLGEASAKGVVELAGETNRRDSTRPLGPGAILEQDEVTANFHNCKGIRNVPRTDQPTITNHQQPTTNDQPTHPTNPPNPTQTTNPAFFIQALISTDTGSNLELR